MYPLVQATLGRNRHQYPGTPGCFFYSNGQGQIFSPTFFDELIRINNTSKYEVNALTVPPPDRYWLHPTTFPVEALRERWGMLWIEESQSLQLALLDVVSPLILCMYRGLEARHQGAQASTPLPVHKKTSVARAKSGNHASVAVADSASSSQSTTPHKIVAAYRSIDGV